MSGHRDYGRLHIFWSDNVHWKKFFKFQIVENNAYPMYGRSAIESGERLFYRMDFFCCHFMVGTRGILFHWYPSRIRPTEPEAHWFIRSKDVHTTRRANKRKHRHEN